MIALYLMYAVLKWVISTRQIGYIERVRRDKPVLMNAEAYQKAAAYAVEKEKLERIGSLMEPGLFLFWILYGIPWLESVVPFDGLILSTVFVLGFLLIHSLLPLPLDIYRTFVLDKAYGFSNTSPKIYLSDQLKSFALLILIGGPVVYGIGLIVNGFETWWLWGFIFVFALLVGVNALYPTVIAPMFNTFKPLENADLEKAIVGLLEKAGFGASGVFVVDASKRDSRLNAYFGGLGKIKRVVLFDTLIEKLDQAGLLAVLGHELGHFAHRDILKNIALMGSMLFLAFFLFGNLPASLYAAIGVQESAHMFMVLFLLLSPVLFFFFMPLFSFFSRDNEYAADRYGAEMGGKENLVRALLTLVTENKAFPKSDPWYIFFYYSHPPLIERLRALGYEADSLPEMSSD